MQFSCCSAISDNCQGLLPSWECSTITLLASAILLAVGIAMLAYCVATKSPHAYTCLTAIGISLFMFIPASRAMRQATT